MKRYLYAGNTLVYTPGISVTCGTASVPYIIAQAVKFMAEYGVQVMTLDGTEIHSI